MTVADSDFANGREGWIFDGDASNVDYRNGGEFIRGGTGGLFFEGERGWNGFLADAVGGTLSFRLRQDGTDGFFDSGARVEIIGRDGDVLSVTFNVEGNAWSSYAFDMTSFGGWRINNGSIASETDIKDVLGNVERIRISGDFRTGDTYTDLDDVVLTRGDNPDRGDRVFNDFYNEVRSTFKIGGESWGFINDVQNFNHLEEGGRRNGFIEAVDRASGQIMYYIAPEEFTGEKPGFYGGKLSFWLKISSSSSASLGGDEVVIVGANGRTITWDAGRFPGSDWTKFQVRLGTSAGWESDGGIPATREDIQGVLNNISELRIRGEFVNGSETSGLDDVLMEAPDRGYDIFAPRNRFLGSEDDFQSALNSLRNSEGREVLVTKETTGDFFLTARRVTITDPLDNLDVNFTLNGTRSLNVSGGEFIGVRGDDQVNKIFIDDALRAVIRAGGGNDEITFGDRVRGNIRGDKGDDRLFGGNGRDIISGGSDEDLIVGDGGNDELKGGADPDDFLFNGINGWDRDLIKDFEVGSDQVIFVQLGQTFGITEFDDLDGLWGESPNGNLTLIIGENVITFRGITDPSQFGENDFVFQS